MILEVNEERVGFDEENQIYFKEYKNSAKNEQAIKRRRERNQQSFFFKYLYKPLYRISTCLACLTKYIRNLSIAAQAVVLLLKAVGIITWNIGLCFIPLGAALAAEILYIAFTGAETTLGVIGFFSLLAE